MNLASQPKWLALQSVSQIVSLVAGEKKWITTKLSKSILFWRINFFFNSIKKNLHNETQSNPEQNWTPQIAEENIAEYRLNNIFCTRGKLYLTLLTIQGTQYALGHKSTQWVALSLRARWWILPDFNLGSSSGFHFFKCWLVNTWSDRLCISKSYACKQANTHC